jgi:hypothetical protein
VIPYFAAFAKQLVTDSGAPVEETLARALAAMTGRKLTVSRCVLYTMQCARVFGVWGCVFGVCVGGGGWCARRHDGTQAHCVAVGFGGLWLLNGVWEGGRLLGFGLCTRTCLLTLPHSHFHPPAQTRNAPPPTIHFRSMLTGQHGMMTLVAEAENPLREWDVLDYVKVRIL